MPIATTIDEIRSSIVATIRGINPTYTPTGSQGWRPVSSTQDVPSLGLRSYFVEIRDIVEDGEIYGECAGHTATLNIWTSYGGVSPADQQVLSARDQQDLWRELHRAQIDGAPKFEKQGFEESNEDGRQWGAHVFTAYLFLPLP
jgi:hypothetical protein